MGQAGFPAAGPMHGDNWFAPRSALHYMGYAVIYSAARQYLFQFL